MGKNKKKKNRSDIPSAKDIATRYGTYNIQPTADTDNKFPEIAQGLSDKQKRED